MRISAGTPLCGLLDLVNSLSSLGSIHAPSRSGPLIAGKPALLCTGARQRGERFAGRAILGGLLAGEPATLFVLPALYSLFIHDTPEAEEERRARHAAHPAANDVHSDPTSHVEWDHNGGDSENHPGH